MDMILIPSYKRAEYLLEDRRYNTLRWLSEDVKKKVSLFVREEEKEDYTITAKARGVGLIPIPYTYPHSSFGVRETREFAFVMGRIFGANTLTVLDDDLCFERRIDEQGHYRTDGTAPFDEAFEWLTKTTREEPVRGLTSRGFASARSSLQERDKGLIQVFSFYMPLFNEDHSLMEFTRSPGRFMSDYWFNLNLLASGYHTCMSYEWCKSDEPRIEGGCEASGRTIPLVNESALALGNAFPEVVTVRQKQTAHWGPSYGVTIQWKKAFNLYARRAEARQRKEADGVR